MYLPQFKPYQMSSHEQLSNLSNQECSNFVFEGLSDLYRSVANQELISMSRN